MNKVYLFIGLGCVSGLAWTAFAAGQGRPGNDDSSRSQPIKESIKPAVASSPQTPIARLDISEPAVPHAHAPVENPWWEDEAAIDAYADIFAEEIEQYRADFLISCERDKYGDQNVRGTMPSWGRFHSEMMPSKEMYKGLTQGEKWCLALMLQHAGHNTRENQGVIPTNLSVQGQLAFREHLRDKSLYYSPEFILNDRFDGDWANEPYLAEEVRTLWIEMVQLAAPLEAELNVRQRCAMNVTGDFDDTHLSLISPGLREYEIQMEALHQEFYDKVDWLIKDVGS